MPPTSTFPNDALLPVKNELVKTFNVKGDRLVTDGKGESQPVAPNDTPVNKALNRRVEFVKLK